MTTQTAGLFHGVEDTQTHGDDLKLMYKLAREAFAEVEFWDQQRIDEVVAAVGWELQKKEVAEKLARLAIDESGIGVYEDKVHKISAKTRGTMRDSVGQKSCGIIKDDKEAGIRIYAKPMGVIANVVPCTNPESTICCLALSTLKTRNAQIVTPHPRTQGSSYLTVVYVRNGTAKSGGS
jgi:sulfoacetaldehyde dehydrogenase